MKNDIFAWRAGFTALSLSFVFSACGDDSSFRPNEHVTVDKSEAVESVEDLLNCTEKRDGLSVFVEEENAFYKCDDGRWHLNGVLESSSSKKSSSSSQKFSSSQKASSSSQKNSSSQQRSSSSEKSSSSSFYAFNPNISYGELKDARDGKKYKTVKIGDQIWMAENLNYEDSPVVDGKNSWCYNNNPENCERYGRLYTWSLAMDSSKAGDCGYGVTCTIKEPHQGICPEGWHVPTNDEYKMLYEYVGGEDVAPQVLKSTDGWDFYNGSNEFGFSLIPGGYRNINGEFIRMGEHANLWSATENSATYAIDQFFDSYERIRHDRYTKTDGHNVRCLSDESAMPKSSSSLVSSSSEKSSSSVAPSSSFDYGTLEDERDGLLYKTIEIGDQVWMAENLRFEGGNIKDGENSWCYDNNPVNCEKYGRLYTWAATMDSTQEGDCGYGVLCTITEPHQGICPKGWHVPTDDEFNILYEYVGGKLVAPQKLKSKTGWGYYNGIDAYGFNLLPGGFYNPKDEFIRIGEHANIWSASETSVDRVIDQYFDEYGEIVYEEYTKTDGHSVRCLQD